MTAITIGLAAYDSMKTKTALSLATAVAATAGAGVDINFAARSRPYVHWEPRGARRGRRERRYKPSDDDRHRRCVPPGCDPALLRFEIHRGRPFYYADAPAVHTIKFAREDDSDEATVRVLPTDPFRCAAVPTGFMLIDIAAARHRVPRPCSKCVRPVGEDVSFW